MKEATREFFLALSIVLYTVHQNRLFYLTQEARASVPAHLWSQGFGDASSQFAHGVATDASGNIIVIGHFQGTVNFGGSDLTSSGGYDVFVAKFDRSGVHQWSARFGDASPVWIPRVRIDSASGTVTVPCIRMLWRSIHPRT